MTQRGTALTAAVFMLTLMLASCTPMGEGVLRKDAEVKVGDLAGEPVADTLGNQQSL